MRVFCDSSLREACTVIEGREPLVTPYLEPTTVNVGEYVALISTLKLLYEMEEEKQEQDIGHLEIFSDSQLIVNQVLGKWKCEKPHLLPYLKATQAWMKILGEPKLQWIEREKNLAGLELERRSRLHAH